MRPLRTIKRSLEKQEMIIARRELYRIYYYLKAHGYTTGHESIYECITRLLPGRKDENKA